MPGLLIWKHTAKTYDIDVQEITGLDIKGVTVREGLFLPNVVKFPDTLFDKPPHILTES